MDYITVRQAAQKWNISERLVQKYCSQGRIDGVRKFGKSWGIPDDAVKPEDPRKSFEEDIGEEQTEENKTNSADDVIHKGLMPLLNTAFEPGHCIEYIEKIQDKDVREIADAEYKYFSGQAEEAIRKVEAYLTSSNTELRLSACLIYAYANLTMGEIQRARYALTELKLLMSDENKEKNPYLRSAESFIASTAAVLLHLPLPEGLPPAQEFMHMLPPGLKVFALYVMAHYKYLQGEYEKSLGIVEATLTMQGKIYPIPTIYIHLVAVMDYMSLKDTERAEKHLLAAWELARPDDLIEGFGEHHGLLGGMLEAVIKKDWPEDFKRIIAITYKFSSGWRKIHNPDTGHDVADNLTTTEFAAAMLAARGWTNQEIGEHMNISPNTVKRYISTALQKLNINHRQDLKKYMLL